MARSLAIALLTGCSFSLSPGGTSDAPAGDGVGDAIAIDAAPIDAAPLGAWSAPQRFAELTTTDGEDDPSLTSDLLEIYFGSNRPNGLGNEDIWFATRLTANAAFGPPVNVALLSSPDSESNIRVSADGLTIFFASNRSPSQDFDLWTSRRVSRAAPWSVPTRVVELSSPQGDYMAYPSPDSLQVTFCSNRSGGNENLFRATRTATNMAWGAPSQITDTSTTANECDPMDPDPTTLYFASTRPGTLGQYDLYVATRPFGGAYAVAAPLTGINSTFNDRDVWVSPDQRLLVFSSNRMGGDDLYFATR